MKRIPELEGIRGILALMVVLGHSLVSGPYPFDSLPLPLQWMGNGGFAVQVFIVLSGFVIFLLLDQSHERYDQFLVRRACRLFPIYWVCLAISVLMVPMSMAAMERLPWCEQAFKGRLLIFDETNKHWISHLVAHITLLHGAVPNGILPKTALAFIGQAWSVSVEWQFYLIAPLIYAIGRRKRSLAVVILVVALVAAQRWLSFQSACVFAQTHLFALGACGYFAYREIVRHKDHLVRHRALVTLAPIALTLLFRGQPAMVGFAFVLSLVIGAELMPTNPIVTLCSRPLCSRPAAYLGQISYCIYLSHMIVHYALLSLLAPCASQPMLFLWLHSIGSLAGAVLISIPLSHWVEYPAIDCGRWLSKKLAERALRRRMRRETQGAAAEPALG